MNFNHFRTRKRLRRIRKALKEMGLSPSSYTDQELVDNILEFNDICNKLKLPTAEEMTTRIQELIKQIENESNTK